MDYCRGEVHVCQIFDMMKPSIGRKNSKTFRNLLFTTVKKPKKCLYLAESQSK